VGMQETKASKQQAWELLEWSRSSRVSCARDASVANRVQSQVLGGKVKIFRL